MTAVVKDARLSNSFQAGFSLDRMASARRPGAKFNSPMCTNTCPNLPSSLACQTDLRSQFEMYSLD
jgi:hypothetical protein